MDRRNFFKSPALAALAAAFGVAGVSISPAAARPAPKGLWTFRAPDGTTATAEVLTPNGEQLRNVTAVNITASGTRGYVEMQLTIIAPSINIEVHDSAVRSRLIDPRG